jgi:hypothetical protein
MVSFCQKFIGGRIEPVHLCLIVTPLPSLVNHTRREAAIDFRRVPMRGMRMVMG